MAKEKIPPTLADYVITAISPVLIMGLIGSLVFFLVEILYAGQYEGRLVWTLFFYVVGIVLVARISIEADMTRAMLYGLGLALVCYLALMAFINYPKDSSMANYAGLINFFLMAVIWFCAHKLTWDCTFIDEKRPGSGKGLLAAAGFEQRAETRGQVRDSDVPRDPGSDVVQPPPNDRGSLGKRWRRFRERQKKRPHNPGLTVVWFSLAALPIFGLGQSLIPAEESSRRTYSFWLAAFYVGCALGLLLTTSFLGLRRYLRQRQLQMPKALTAIWLGAGGLLVGGFLLVAALLPRPYSETPIVDIGRLTSKDRNAAKHSLVRDSSGKGDSNAGGKAPDDKAEGKSDDSNGGNQDQQRKGGGKGKGRSNSDDQSNEKQGEAGDSRGKSNADGKDGKSGGGRQKGKGDAKSGDQQQDSRDKSGGSRRDEPANDSRFSNSTFGGFLHKVLMFLKWLVFILLALLVLLYLFRNSLQYLANFMPGARRLLKAFNRWWEGLWNRARRKRPTVAAAPAAEAAPKRRPFTSFLNPFAGGSAEDRPLPDLVAYSFEALEAWAADRNHARQIHETPLEFAARLSNTFSSLEGEAQRLAVLVVRVAYANGVLPPDSLDTLDRVWDRLTLTMPAPAAVGSDAP